MKQVLQITILLLVVFLTSCVSRKKITYFQDIDGIEVQDSILNYEPRIQIGDMLRINVSATDAEAAIPFNLYETPVLNNRGFSNLVPVEYIVNDAGEINFPILGEIKVIGLTTSELTVKLEEMLMRGYIKDPVINLWITNFKINVLGEVKMPGAYVIKNSRVNVLEALSLAGDLTIHGDRADVTLIRNQQGKKEFIKIDMRNKELFNSPYFYLVQNDIIYVSQNKAKVNSSAVGTHTAVIISSLSVLIALLAIFLK